ncbi:response regulator [Paenibacillus sp. HJGM_3]|uniref:response regulator n=1 Tax=Paenibacillus sp. HJGM_3 TaxID=3379816 RepID=UPI00385A37F0
MHTVMIVDDAAFMRTIIKDIVCEIGCSVVAEAENGEEAVKMYSRTRPDLVTMDITMPLMDGVTALRKIKAIDPQAKVIVCSAMSHQPMVIEAISLGAKDFIAKPVQKERVQHTIRKILEQA